MASAAALAPTDPRPRAAAPRVPYPLVALLLFVSTALRLPATFLYPSFSAEDLTVFFKQSIEMGPGAVVQPLYGSYHTLPRLIAFGALLFPAGWAPALYALGAGLVSSFALALFSRPGFRWLVPRDDVRLLACWLFSVARGTNEGFFTLCVSNYSVFVAVLLLLLERDEAGRWQMGRWRAVLVSFLWFSLGQGVVLALPLAYLFWLTRNRNYLVCLGALGLAVLLNLVSASENSFRPPVFPGFDQLALVYVENISVRLLFIPLAQPWIGRVLAMPDALFFPLSALLAGAGLYAVFRKRALDGEGARVLGVTILATMAHFPLTALARTYGVEMLRRGPETHLGGRHALVPSILGLVLLGLWLTRPPWSRWGRALAVAFLVWASANILSEPFYERPWPFRPFVWEWPRSPRPSRRRSATGGPAGSPRRSW